jgi:hypothetical protein
MWYSLFSTATLFATFCGIDRFLLYCHIQGVYYLLQGIQNAILTILTVSTAYTTIIEMESHIYLLHKWLLPVWFAFHFYHITIYHSIFRAEDWIHSTERLFIPLIGWYTQSICLQYSIFFVSIPAGLDYLLLFLMQNRLSIQTYDRIYTWMNRWVRQPFCQMHYCITVLYLIKHVESFSGDWCVALLALLMIYGNDIYYERHRKEVVK